MTKYTEDNFCGCTFHRWTVLSYDKTNSNGSYWMCKCVCGTIRSVNQGHLIKGATKSCGCWNRQVARARMAVVARVHGLTNTGLFRSWSDMKTRCLNKKHKDYKNYGGRGITVCKTWYSFTAFIKDMGESWHPGMTIERKDVNGDYTPENCHWVSKERQACNRRSTLWAFHDGVKMCCSDIARCTGVSKHVARRRILSQKKEGV